MAEVETDDWFGHIPASVKWLVAVAVVTGAGGNVNTLVSTDDRFRGADFRREIAVRDAEILRLRRELESHLRHSARYTEKIITDDKRLDELERKFERHTDREAH